MSAQKGALKKGLIILLVTIFALIMGVIALWRMEIQENSLAELWEGSDKRYIIVALFLISSAMPFVAMRWRALLPNKTLHSPLLLTGILSAAFVFNIALPGPVGELISAGMVQKKYKTPFAEAIASLLVSRIIGLGSACLIAGLMYFLFPLQLPPKWDGVLNMSAIVLTVGSLGIISLGVFPQFFLRMVLHVQLKGLLKKVQAVIIDGLEALIKTAKRGIKAYFESFFWAICGHVMVASGIFAAAKSIGLHVSWTAITFTYAASIAASVAMFMLPGSSAAWDILFATTLSVAGDITVMEAASITLVVRLQQLLVVLVGLLVLWWMSKDLLNIEEAVSNE